MGLGGEDTQLMELVFYRWFLARLLEALAGRGAETVHAADAVTITPTAHAHDAPAGVTVTPRQALLSGRPGTPTNVTRVSGEWRTLGDGTRLTPPLMAGPPVMVSLPTGNAWLPPWPVMPPQAGPTSAAWNGPEHAAHAFHPANDGLFDAAYTREDGSGFCMELPSNVTPVEVSGVFATPHKRRCSADNKARPEHLGTDARFNMRLPVMAGVDGTGRYLRVVKMPLKTHEYLEF